MLCEPDPLLYCPFDTSHSILRSRFQRHLKKCKKNHTLVNKFYCPYNTSHVVDSLEYEHHVKFCDGMKVVIRTDFKKEDGTVDEEQNLDGVVAIQDVINIVQSVESEENWDEEPNRGSYNALEVMENQPILRIKSGLSKAQRREYRQMERARMKSLLNNSSNNFPGKEKISVVDDLFLRAPREFSHALGRNSSQDVNDTTLSTYRNGEQASNTVLTNTTQDLNDIFKSMDITDKVSDKKVTPKVEDNGINDTCVDKDFDKSVIVEEEINIKYEKEYNPKESISHSPQQSTTNDEKFGLTSVLRKVSSRLSWLVEVEKKIQDERVELTDMFTRITTELQETKLQNKSCSSQKNLKTNQNPIQNRNPIQDQDAPKQSQSNKLECGTDNDMIEKMMPRYCGRGIKMAYVQRKPMLQNVGIKSGIQRNETVTQSKQNILQEEKISKSISAILKSSISKQDKIPVYNDVECGSVYGYGEDSDNDFDLE